jgi:hypothetical protein
LQTCLLLEVKDGELEFGFNLGVLGLNAFQAIDPPSDRSWQAVDVSGWLADETSKLALSKSEQSGVLAVSAVPCLISCPGMWTDGLTA